MQKITFFLLVFIAAQGISQNTSPITYDLFLSNVLQNNPLAKRANNEKKYGETQLNAAKGNYDPIMSGSYDQKQFNGINYFTNVNSEIKQAIFTSQYLKFGYDYGNGNYLNPENNSLAPGQAYLGIEIGLLQGLRIDKRRAEFLKSKEYLNYYEAEQRIQLNSLLFESSQRYFDWLFNLKQLALNQYFMQIAKQRLNGIEALAIIGERASVDTIEAAIFYQARLSDLQNALIENQKVGNEILSYNWQKDQSSNLNENISTNDSLDMYFNKAKKILNEQFNQSQSANPVITKYHSLQKVLEVENRLKKEMIKPLLNFKYNFLSNNALSAYPSLSNNNYKVGMQLSFPIFLRNPTNDYKMAKINAQNNQLELISKTTELSFKTQALKKTMAILANQLQNAEKTVRYSKVLVDAEKLKFANGESTLFMLNTRESKWLESEIKLAEFKLKFIKTLINLIYLNGDLNYAF
ncbi:MAG: TolC family protein [Bacteroidota bacterium]